MGAIMGLRLALDKAMRREFQLFVERAFQELFPNDKYSRGWYVQAICWHLHLVNSGEMLRLIINLPPRTLKSFIVSVAWPAFLLGRDPTLRIICVSYSDDLAREHARLFRLLISSDFFRRLFPLMRVSPDKNTESMVATTANGFRLATSIGGTLTGKGGNLVIIDDPMKAGAVNSAIERQRVIDWFTSTLITRLDDPARSQIVVVMQRIHAFDLSGYLLEKGGWAHLTLAAECRLDQSVPIGLGKHHVFKDGDLLDNVRLPLEVLIERYGDLGEPQFNAQYLQDPVPPDGNIIKREYFRYYDFKEGMFPGYQIIQSWDVAAKTGEGNDYSVCITMAIGKDGFYVIDVTRVKREFTQLVPLVQELYDKYRPRQILIEDSSNGTALLSHLKDTTHLPVLGITPKLDKVTRVLEASASFAAGRVKFAKDAAWLTALENEHLEFPNGKHDDQVDALVQGINWAREHYSQYFSLIVGPVNILKDEADRFFRDEDFGSLNDPEDTSDE